MHQILAWLQHIHPAPYTVRLRVEKIPKSADAFADCGRHGPRGRLFLIRLEPVLWRVMVDRLLHEYAHAMAWPPSAVERHVDDHSDEWALAYGRIYRHFFDEKGAEDAASYPWR